MAFALAGAYCLIAIVAPLLIRNATSETLSPMLGPSGRYWLGTDELGRNELSMILVGARVAILAAVESVVIAAIVGTALGVAAGYFGGLLDELLSRVADLIFSVPSYLLAVLVVVILGPGLTQASVAIGIVFVPQFARITRGGTLAIRDRAYIDAARLAGRSHLYIMCRHVVPNLASELAPMLGLTLANAEGTYALLSYLGFGVRPPTPDYGSMLAAAQQYFFSDAWLIVFPSLALLTMIVGFVLLGDWLGMRFDPYGRTLLRGIRRGR
jgi:ABC-type dipeptide/oligopeptide/nickel transport system permease subunit